MSGKVAKPKEDKDASKGKRRDVPAIQTCFTPQSQVVVGVFSERDRAPIHPLHAELESPFGASTEHNSSHWTVLSRSARCMWTLLFEIEALAPAGLDMLLHDV